METVMVKVMKMIDMSVELRSFFFFFDKQEKYIKREVVQGIPQPLQ
jgi:hypothetical protein